MKQHLRRAGAMAVIAGAVLIANACDDSTTAATLPCGGCSTGQLCAGDNQCRTPCVGQTDCPDCFRCSAEQVCVEDDTCGASCDEATPCPNGFACASTGDTRRCRAISALHLAVPRIAVSAGEATGGDFKLRSTVGGAAGVSSGAGFRLVPPVK